MGTIKQKISLFLTIILMVSSVVTQANACSDTQQASAIESSHCSADSENKVSAVHEESNQDSSDQHPSQHCHCVSQACCGFLVIPVISSIGTDSKVKGSPLVSAALYSWISATPTRPPSA